MSEDARVQNIINSIFLLDEKTPPDTAQGLEQFADLEKFVEESLPQETLPLPHNNQVQNEALMKALKELKNKMTEINRAKAGNEVSSKE